MKRLGLLLLVFALSASYAFAGQKNMRVRYKTNYQTWDRTVTTHYSYSETRYSSECRGTCYEGYNSHDSVYVEETVIRDSSQFNGYTKVTVYETESFDRPYVSYYTHNRTVVRREFHRPHRHIHHHHVHRHYTHFHYHEYDEVSAAIELGTYMIIIGADLLGDCGRIEDDNSQLVCIGFALASSASGSVSYALASKWAAEKTELQQKLVENSKNKEEDLFETEE